MYREQEEILEDMLAACDDEAWLVARDAADEDVQGWADAESGCPPEYAGLAHEEIDALADAREAAHAAAPEVVEAGFLPRDMTAARPSAGPVGGFASGEALDTALPGPGLAGFADEVTGPGGRCAGASDDELIGLLRAWQRTESWAGARKLAVIAELIRRRPAPGTEPAPGAPGAMPDGWGRFCGDELAAATACSAQAAEKALMLAHDLAARLRSTAQALHEGRIDLYKAKIIVDAARVLDDADAAAAEALVLADLAGKTPGQIRAAISRAVIKVNPDAARERREQAQRDARVELWREDAGTAALCGFGLPPDEALAADQLISARARELKASGLDGTMDQLRIRAYLDFLLGKDSRPDSDTAASGEREPQNDQSGGGTADRSPASDSPASDDTASNRPVSGTSSGSDTASGGPGSATPSGSDSADGALSSCGTPPEDRPPGAAGAEPATGRPGTSGFAARINLTIPLMTLLSLAERPGEADRLGAIDPHLARTLATAAAGHPRTTWCVTVTDQAGHPTAHGCARPDRPRTRGRSPAKDTGPPGQTGPAGTSTGADSSPPPTGNTGTLRAAGEAGNRDGPGFTFSHGPPRADRPGRWRLRTPGSAGRHYTIAIEPLAVTDCDHRHFTAAYQPGATLRHLVNVRDGQCTWPPCRRAAERCDFEHARPWDQGGATCACNAGARCRHHHLAKQAPGWRLEQPEPGYHTWTTPSGRQYTIGPTTYPI